MEHYWNIFQQAFKNYASYVWQELTFNTPNPWWQNYLLWLILVSLFFFGLELIKPWREGQSKFRKDFWLDAWYMFFNFFVFSLIGYYAISEVFVNLFKDFLALFGIRNLVAFHIDQWPFGVQLIALLFTRDFIQWWIHRLLHRVPFLWEFHKVHHSVQQMGFAAHLRFHWMETVVYRFFEYLPLAMLGFNLGEYFAVHIFTLSWGHFNHSNFKIPLGPLKYLFNNPEMHIWHHAHDLPRSKKYGVNFGLTLSLWDYLFGTAFIPKDGRDIKLGFPGVEQFPNNFFTQFVYGLGLRKSTNPPKKPNNPSPK